MGGDRSDMPPGGFNTVLAAAAFILMVALAVVLLLGCRSTRPESCPKPDSAYGRTK